MNISSKKEFYEEDYVMNYNYENIRMIMEGAGILYSMLCDLTEGIGNLPGCKMTAALKYLSANISASSGGIYQTMKNIASEESFCDACEDNADDCENIPSGSDLKEFLGAIEEIFASGKPMSISADIYINEEKDNGKSKE